MSHHEASCLCACHAILTTFSIGITGTVEALAWEVQLNPVQNLPWSKCWQITSNSTSKLYYIHTVAINIIQIPVSHVCVYIYIHTCIYIYMYIIVCICIYIYITTYPISAYLCNWICVPLPAKRWAAWQLMSPGHGDPESSGLAMVS